MKEALKYFILRGIKGVLFGPWGLPWVLKWGITSFSSDLSYLHQAMVQFWMLKIPNEENELTSNAPVKPLP